VIIHRPALFQKRPACVLLDLDHTLYDYPSCNAAGMNAAVALAHERLNIPASELLHAFDQARTELKARLGAQAASHSRLLYFQGMVERAGLASQPALALQLDQAFWRAYLEEARLFDQAHAFLNDLRLLAIPVIVVTDQLAQIQIRKLVALGLDGLVGGLVTSEETGQDKPAAVNFQLALAKAAKTTTGDPVWMIGDDPVRDLAGAKQAIGAVTLHRTLAGRPVIASEAIDAAFHGFADLRTLLAGLGSPETFAARIGAAL
jgi:putative hydrolase of the HAD superfamily